MKPLRALLLAITMGGLLLGSAPSHAATTTEQYTAGPVGDAGYICRQGNPAADVNVGGVCFDVKDVSSGTVTVHDDTNSNVVFFYQFLDSSGACVGQGSDPTAACPNSDSAQGHVTLKTPTDAVELDIEFTGPIFATIVAGDPTAFATTGTVKLDS